MIVHCVCVPPPNRVLLEGLATFIPFQSFILQKGFATTVGPPLLPPSASLIFLCVRSFSYPPPLLNISPSPILKSHLPSFPYAFRLYPIVLSSPLFPCSVFSHPFPFILLTYPNSTLTLLFLPLLSSSPLALSILLGFLLLLHLFLLVVLQSFHSSSSPHSEATPRLPSPSFTPSPPTLSPPKSSLHTPLPPPSCSINPFLSTPPHTFLLVVLVSLTTSLQSPLPILLPCNFSSQPPSPSSYPAPPLTPSPQLLLPSPLFSSPVYF